MNKFKTLLRAAAVPAGLTGLALVLAAAPAAADFVINDDLIVDGSACIGFDCVNGETFGFDTLRLKENNLRIRAFDTSTSASFPTRDWEITFNETSNGGQEKFSITDIDAGRIPFTIEGNADAHSIYVDTGGKIGFGTSAPVVELHIKDGDTPTIRLEQDGSSGFTPQVWDLAGNETNFFVRDVTNGSTLPLRIRPGAPSSSIDIANNGNVGIGDSSPDHEMVVQSDGSNGDVFVVEAAGGDERLVRVFETGNTSGLISVFNDVDAEAVRIVGQAGGKISIGCNSPGTPDLTINSAGSGACGAGTESTVTAGDTNFTVTSSRTIKEHLVPVTKSDILDRIASVPVYTYDYINGPKNRLGLVAEDFHTVFGRGSEKVINGQEVQMALWLAVQELRSEVTSLKSELAAAKAAGSE